MERGRKERTDQHEYARRTKKVLGVVGAGHLDGVVRQLQHDAKRPDLEALEKVPEKRLSIPKLIAYAIPFLFFAFLGWAVFTGDWSRVGDVLLWWFLINGVLSAIGAAVVKGHPYSVAAAFLAAPFTSLNPTIAAGWVAGIVEAKVRTPTIKDFNGLRELESWSDFTHNRLIRVLLVAACANVGSVIGTFVALPYIIGLGFG